MTTWELRNGSNIEFRGSIRECGERWRSHRDRFSMSVTPADPIDGQEPGDELVDLMVFMECGSWPKPDTKYPAMLDAVKKMGAASAKCADEMIMRAFKPEGDA